MSLFNEIYRLETLYLITINARRTATPIERSLEIESKHGRPMIMKVLQPLDAFAPSRDMAFPHPHNA